MREVLDIQKLRKKRQRLARLKQIIILGVIFLGILTALYINDVMIRKNLTSKIGGMVESVGGEGFPTSIPSGRVRNIKNVGKNLVVLKDSNLYMYNNKGKQIKNIQQMTDRTLLDSNEERLLYYDVGGREVNVSSAIGDIYKIEYDSNIIHADVGNSGEVAVVTSPPNFVAEVNVYGLDKSEPFFTKYFSEDLVSSVAVSPKGKQIAVSTIGTDGGVIDFNIEIYSLEKVVEPTVISLGDRMILDVNYYQEDTIMVLTDRDYLIFDVNTTKLVNSHTFSENSVIQEFRKKDDHILVLSKDKDTREYIFNIINPSGTSLSNMRVKNKPLDFDFAERSIYLLNGDKVEEYNFAMNLMGSYDVLELERIYALKSDVYLISKTEIDVLNRAKETK